MNSGSEHFINTLNMKVLLLYWLKIWNLGVFYQHFAPFLNCTQTHTYTHTCPEWCEYTLRCSVTLRVRLREQAWIQPICFSVMWLLQRSRHIINHPTEPNASNCIISVGTDYKVTATAQSYKWDRDKWKKPRGFWEGAFYKCKLHIFRGSDFP